MQEIIATIWMTAVFGGVVLAFIYMRILTIFFNQLRQKEPDVWHEIGEPTLWNMLAMPSVYPHKYYAFLSKLKERSCHPDYQYAHKAHRLLKAGLIYWGLIFALSAVMAFAL